MVAYEIQPMSLDNLVEALAWYRPVTSRQLAEIFGISRRRAQRVLTELAKQSRITVVGATLDDRRSGTGRPSYIYRGTDLPYTPFRNADLCANLNSSEAPREET